MADEGDTVDGHFRYFGVEAVGLQGIDFFFAQRTGGDNEFYAVVEELVECLNLGRVYGYDVGFGVEPFEDFDFFFDDGFEGLIDTDGDDPRSRGVFQRAALALFVAVATAEGKRAAE